MLGFPIYGPGRPTNTSIRQRANSAATRPGGPLPSVGSTRSAVEQTDRHDQSERNFLKTLAIRLDAAVTAGEVDSLIMVAPPRALGMIRQAYSPHLREAIRAELEKDYVKLPVSEIEAHLCGRDRKR
jgi:protein required for attachment to host cells